MDSGRDIARRLQRDFVDRGCYADPMADDSQAPLRRPGDPRPDIESMIRVDQAGEYGATRIYAGQLAVLGDRSPAARSIARID